LKSKEIDLATGRKRIVLGGRKERKSTDLRFEELKQDHEQENKRQLKNNRTIIDIKGRI
jgi:hypothetical protein